MIDWSSRSRGPHAGSMRPKSNQSRRAGARRDAKERIRGPTSPDVSRTSVTAVAGHPMHMAILAAQSPFDAAKHAVNAATKPEWFLTITFIVFVLMFVLYRWWTRPLVFADDLRAVHPRVLRVDGGRQLPVDRRQAGQRADHHHGDQRDDLHLARVPAGGAERRAAGGGAAAAGGGQGRQGPRLAGPGLHGADLPGHRDGRADALGHYLQGARSSSRPTPATPPTPPRPRGTSSACRRCSSTSTRGWPASSTRG